MPVKTVDELTPQEFTLPPLHQAARQRDVEKARELILLGYAVDEKCTQNERGEGGNAPLWYAAQGLSPGGVPIAELLLNADAAVNERGEFGMTAMHMACSWGHADMVQYLHAHGADLSIIDDYGRTAIAIATKDYQEGMETPMEKRLPGWERWLEGMAAINSYFDTVQDSPHGERRT